METVPNYSLRSVGVLLIMAGAWMSPAQGQAGLTDAQLASASFVVSHDSLVTADSATADDPEETEYGVTGDWGGLRPRLGGAGVNFEGTFVGDMSGLGANASGRRLAARSLTDLAFTLDLDRLAGLKGVTVFADIQAQAGPNGS